MGKKIFIIHTSNVSYYDLQKLCAEIIPEVEVRNIVDDSLLQEVKTVGHITPDIISRMCSYYKTAEMLGARVILPMHYRTKYNADWPIAPAEDFLALYDEKDVARQPLLRVTQGDLICQKKVCLLEAQLKG